MKKAEETGQEGRRVEEVFLKALGSPVRLKILLALARSSNEMSIYMICKATGCNRQAVSRHLTKLVDVGLVERHFYGEIQVFGLIQEKREVKALARFFRECALLG